MCCLRVPESNHVASQTCTDPTHTWHQIDQKNRRHSQPFNVNFILYECFLNPMCTRLSVCETLHVANSGQTYNKGQAMHKSVVHRMCYIQSWFPCTTSHWWQSFVPLTLVGMVIKFMMSVLSSRPLDELSSFDHPAAKQYGNAHKQPQKPTHSTSYQVSTAILFTLLPVFGLRHRCMHMCVKFTHRDIVVLDRYDSACGEVDKTAPRFPPHKRNTKNSEYQNEHSVVRNVKFVQGIGHMQHKSAKGRLKRTW